MNSAITEAMNDYGQKGRIGIGTPQANPTVEVECAHLMPHGVSMMTSRLTSAGATPKERFVDYSHGLARTLQTYDTLQLSAYGFACTASTYMLGKDEEQAMFDQLAGSVGYPIVTAACALEQALESLNARSIAIACPYPDWLLQSAYDYWAGRGFDVVDRISLQPDTTDTRSIYELRQDPAIAAINQAFGRHEGGCDYDHGHGIAGAEGHCGTDRGVPASGDHIQSVSGAQLPGRGRN